MLVSLARSLGRAMFQILLKIGYSDADIGFLVINTIESELLEESYDLVLRTLTDDDIPTHVQENMFQTSFAEQATNVRAPVLPFSIQGGNKHGIGVDLKRSLAELLRTDTSAQVEDLKSRFFQGQLHDSIANYVNVVPDNTNDNPPSINAHLFLTCQT